MDSQVTIRDVPVEDVEIFKREAAAQRVSLNSALRAVIVAEAGRLRRRRRASVEEVFEATDQLRARIAEEAGGYVTDSTQLIREDRDSR